MFIQSQKIREKIRRHQRHQSLPKIQDVKSVQTSQDEPKPIPYNKPVRITHKQSHKCFTTSHFYLCFLMFQCNFSEFSLDMCKSLRIFEQTDHSDRTDDHHTQDVAEVHKCNAVLSDGHKQLDMQRQGFTLVLTVKYLLKRKREREREKQTNCTFSATKNQSWQRAKSVFILHNKPCILKLHKSRFIGCSMECANTESCLLFQSTNICFCIDCRDWLQAARAACSKWESGWTWENAVRAERTWAEKHCVTGDSNRSSPAEWVRSLKWSGFETHPDVKKQFATFRARKWTTVKVNCNKNFDMLLSPFPQPDPTPSSEFPYREQWQSWTEFHYKIHNKV